MPSPDSWKELGEAPQSESSGSKKIDCRQGVAGNVFTLGSALNLDTTGDRERFENVYDKTLDGKTKSVICHPFHNERNQVAGVLEVINKRERTRFGPEDERVMKVLSLIFSAIFADAESIDQSSENLRLQETTGPKSFLIGKATGMGTLRNMIAKSKDLESSVLIEGERGVGKSLCAQLLHSEGRFGLKAFEEVDCNVKDEALLEGELLGVGDRESRISKAQGGVLFLREISRLPLALQKKLVSHLSGVRVIASTTKNLEKMVKEGEFDRELYHKVSQICLRLPPLRRRRQDIALLANHFLKEECKGQQVPLKSFAPKVMQQLENYDWPGNVRELRRLVERSVSCNDEHILSEVDLNSFTAPLNNAHARQMLFLDLPFVGDSKIPLKYRLVLVERQMILSEIKRFSGNKSRAAKAMGISREALRKKMLISDKVLKELESAPSKKSA